jgi:hypothetical protein
MLAKGFVFLSLDEALASAAIDVRTVPNLAVFILKSVQFICAGPSGA